MPRRNRRACARSGRTCWRGTCRPMSRCGGRSSPRARPARGGKCPRGPWPRPRRSCFWPARPGAPRRIWCGPRLRCRRARRGESHAGVRRDGGGPGQSQGQRARPGANARWISACRWWRHTTRRRHGPSLARISDALSARLASVEESREQQIQLNRGFLGQNRPHLQPEQSGGRESPVGWFSIDQLRHRGSIAMNGILMSRRVCSLSAVALLLAVPTWAEQAPSPAPDDSSAARRVHLRDGAASRGRVWWPETGATGVLGGPGSGAGAY